MKSVPSKRLVVTGILPLALWVVLYFGARIVVGSATLGSGIKVVVALLPVPFFVLSLLVVINRVRSQDELYRRVQLEALAIAFPLCLIMLMTLGLLELVVELSPADWSYRHIWPICILFYLFGLAISWRRYR